MHEKSNCYCQIISNSIFNFGQKFSKKWCSNFACKKISKIKIISKPLYCIIQIKTNRFKGFLAIFNFGQKFSKKWCSNFACKKISKIKIISKPLYCIIQIKTNRFKGFLAIFNFGPKLILIFSVYLHLKTIFLCQFGRQNA